MLTFYYAAGTCAMASHIALEETKLDYKAVKISFQNEEQKAPDFLKINPKGRVPALITNDGILTETPAILAYIAQIADSPVIALPADAFDFARIQSFNSYLCSTVHVAHAHRMRGYRWADDVSAIAAMKAKVPETVSEGFQLIENDLLAGPWVMGDHYTICDPYLFTLATWLEGDGVDINRFPKVREHHDAMLARPAVVAVLEQQGER